ncbi:MAG: MFS transporter, partial [Chloroflexi bacterium]|nr:MFS transporter [Chloroflexota bacterium]
MPSQQKTLSQGKSELKYRWIILAVLTVAFMSTCIARVSVPPLSPFIMDELTLSNTRLGFLMSASFTGGLVMLMPSGFLADTIGTKTMIVIGQIIVAVSMILMFFASSYIYCLLFLFMAGLGGGCIGASSSKALVHWFPLKERATAIGIQATSFNVAGVVTAATLPTLAERLNWHYGFLFIGLVVLVFGSISLLFYKRHPDESQSRRIDVFSKQALLNIFGNKNILLLGFSGLLFCIAEFSFITFTVKYLLQIKSTVGLSAEFAGYYLAMANASGGFGKPIGGIISDRFFKGNRKPVFIIMITIAIIFALLISTISLTTPTWLMSLILIVFGFVIIGWAGLSLTLIAEFSGKEQAGVGYAFGVAIHTIGMLSGPPIF